MEITTSIDYKSLYEQECAANNQLQIEFIQIKQQLDQLKKMIYGSRQERFIPTDINPAQLSLGIQAEQIAGCNIAEAKKITYIKANTTVEQNIRGV